MQRLYELLGDLRTSASGRRWSSSRIWNSFALSILCHDTELAVRLEAVEHEYNVWVVQRPQNGYL